MATRRFISLLAATLLFGAASSHAQNPVLSNPNNRIYWGMRAGVDMVLPSNWHNPAGESIKMFKTGYGVAVGAYCNIPLVANLFLEPGVSFFYNNYRYDDLTIAGADGTVLETDPTVKKYGLRIPVMVGYRFDFSDRFAVSAFTGPELNYALSGSVKFKNKTILDDPELADDFQIFGDNGYQRRINAAWCIGASMEIDYNMTVALTGSIGMNNLMKTHGFTFRENRISLSIGYNF